MNIADTLRGLVRRWYIVLPGLILAMAATIGTFILVQPGFERTSTQLLLPGEGTVPEGTTNPYLFLGGLTQAADIVVRVMNSDEVVGEVVEQYPGTQVVVQRDPTISGPVVQIVVTAKSDEAAAGAQKALLAKSAVVLENLQTEQKVKAADRMTISTLTEDGRSTLQQKNRILVSAGVGIGLVILTLLVASLVDGLIRRAHRQGRGGVRKTASDPLVDDEEGVVPESEASVDRHLGVDDLDSAFGVGESEPDRHDADEDDDDRPRGADEKVGAPAGGRGRRGGADAADADA